MKSLYFCGAGNSEGIRLAYKINQERERWDHMFVLDDDVSRHGKKLLGCEIIGGFEALDDADPETCEVVNLVARTTAGRNSARQKIASYGVPFARLISPNVDIFGAEVAHDAIVYHNATVGPESSLGEGGVVFMGAVVGHEARVGEGCVLAANSVLNARVELGEGVYVGTNSTILPEIRVGARATIGAGSVVLEDVPAGATVMGVPAEILFGGAAKWVAVEDEVSSLEIDHELERRICNVWQELLQLSNVAVEHNFFDMGGSSLLAIRLPERLYRATGKKIGVTDVFRFPTIRSMAAHMTAGMAAGRVGDRRTDEPRIRPNRADLRREIHARWRASH